MVNGPAGSYQTSTRLVTPGPVGLPTPWSGPAGTYTIITPAAVTVEQTATSVVISWGDGPPIPPSPPTPPTPPTPPSPAPDPTAEFQKLGRKYARILPANLADGFDIWASELESGKKVAEANSALKKQWEAARTRSFSEAVGVELAKIVPPNTEPDAASRAKFVKAGRDLAKGLRGD